VSDVVLVKLESIGSEGEPRGFHPPFSILYMAHELEKAGFSLKLFHEEGTPENIESLLGMIAEEDPRLVGFSVLTGPQITPSLEASKKIREGNPVPILWGGLQPALFPEKVLEKEYIDLVALGEGEGVITELASALTGPGQSPDTLKGIAGIGFKNNGRIEFTRERPFLRHLDEVRAAWHYLDIERYIRPEIYLESSMGGVRAIAVNTSRGCPWRCGYCYNIFFNKRRFRAQSAARVIQEVEDLKKEYGITGIRFSEDHFFSDRKRALEIIRSIDLPWTATIRVNDIAEGGEEFVAELAAHKCVLLRCGIESGSQRILDLINKDITLDQIREAARLCAKHGVMTGFFFMLGFPGEEWDDVLDTLDLMDELEALGSSILVALPSIFCPFPGTPLLEKAVDLGFQSPGSIEDWGTTIDVIVKQSGGLPPYADKRVERVIQYLRLARVREFDSRAASIPARFFRKLARLRWKRRFFSFPVDWALASAGRDFLDSMGKII
jgi:radical SAM superfamily enzyme YgiQ (UPF0313 family)